MGVDVWWREGGSMISAGGIPTIDGDMDALAAHAREISTVGAAFAGTGEQVHATWQGLSAVYEAPEAGQLVAATGPVQSVSASVGTDLESAGRALDTYAGEVREIKARLDALRAEAGVFEQPVDGDDDWTEDGDKVDRNNQLIGAVNAAVADFDAAQRRCANAINALYGGLQYRADDGDGQHESGEYGHTAEQLDTAAGSEQGLPWGKTATEDPGLFSSIGHGILDVVGLVPVVGEVADGLNAAWYATEGDTLNASLSAAAMIPFLGWGATGVKAGLRGADAIKSVDEAVSYVRPSGFRNGVRDKVWDDAIEPATGRVRDPVTGQFMSRNNDWHMGHGPGYEFRKHQTDAAERGASRKQFIDEHNDPSHYRPELPSSNRSHRGEDVTDEYLGP